MAKLKDKLNINEIEKDKLEKKIIFFEQNIKDYNAEMEAVMRKIQGLEQK